MKKVLQPVLLLASLITMSFAPVNDTGCSMAHNGTFSYTDDNGKEVIVEIKGDSHTEYHNDRKYVVEAKIKWVSDCEYNSTLVKETLPDVNLAAGTVMNVKIDKIEGDFVFYTATLKGTTFKSSMKKLGDTNGKHHK